MSLTTLEDQLTLAKNLYSQYPICAIGIYQELALNTTDGQKVKVYDILLDTLLETKQYDRVRTLLHDIAPRYHQNVLPHYYLSKLAHIKGQQQAAIRSLEFARKAKDSTDPYWSQKLQSWGEVIHETPPGRILVRAPSTVLLKYLSRLEQLCDIPGAKVICEQSMADNCLKWALGDVFTSTKPGETHLAPHTSITPTLVNDLPLVLPKVQTQWTPALPLSVWQEASIVGTTLPFDNPILVVRGLREYPKGNLVQLGDRADKKIPGAVRYLSQTSEVQLALTYLLGGCLGPQDHWLTILSYSIKTRRLNE